MANFDKYSNYSAETSFSSMVFGEGKPVLEVELNELQQIIHSKIAKIARAIGNKVVFLESPIASNYVVTFPALLVIEESGYVFEVRGASVQYSATNKEIYLKVEEKEVDYTSELKSYGNSDGSIISNPIKDSRVPGETTRRRCVTYTLIAGTSVPYSSSPNIRYVTLATSNSSGTLTYKSHVGYYNIQSILDTLSGKVTKFEDGTLAVGNASKLGGEPASNYVLTKNFGMNTKVGDVSNYSNNLAGLITSISNSCIYVGYASSTTVNPSWFPNNITLGKGMVKITKVSSSRMWLELLDISDASKYYVGAYSNDTFTGWYSTSTTAVVVPASVE